MKIPGIALPASKAWRRRNRRLRRQWEQGDIETNSFLLGSKDDDYEEGYGMGFWGFDRLAGVLGKHKGGGYAYRSCNHWRTPITMGAKAGGTFTVLASGLSDCPRDKGSRELPGPEPYPDLGIYLDDSWFRALGGLASAGIECPVVAWWPFIVVDWGDRSGAPSDEYYSKLVELAVEKIRAGQSVEVACIGGHGRTGTLLAGILASLEGLKAEDAIEQLRKRYCDKAVESYAQRCQVHRFLGEPEPAASPPPALPAVKKWEPITKGSPWTPGQGAVYPKPATQIYAGVGYKSTWDRDECHCSHKRIDHSGSGYGECRLCASGKCTQFRFKCMPASTSKFAQTP